MYGYCEGNFVLHVKCMVHIDLHSRNILLRNRQFVKIIDFGKACMVENPPVYNIKPSSEKQKRYNKFHAHLGYGLRNIPGSASSVQSEVLSIGYNFSNFGITVKRITLWQLQQEC